MKHHFLSFFSDQDVYNQSTPLGTIILEYLNYRVKAANLPQGLAAAECFVGLHQPSLGVLVSLLGEKNSSLEVTLTVFTCSLKFQVTCD